MVLQRFPFAVSAVAVAFAASLAACGGGGSSSGGSPPVPNPTATPPPVSTQQVVIAALPSSVMGSRTDATFGTIGGYTQQTFSQVLGFAPGSQIMVQNGQTSTPHTLGVVSTTGFDATGSALSASASGGSTIQAGFNTGTINPGALVGPFTLVAGTYYIGCAFHYSSAPSMRTVLQVAANATPGPQATAPPGSTSTPDPGPTGY